MCTAKIGHKKSKDLRKSLGSESVSGRLRWFGHVEQKENNDRVKRHDVT